MNGVIYMTPARVALTPAPRTLTPARVALTPAPIALTPVARNARRAKAAMRSFSERSRRFRGLPQRFRRCGSGPWMNAGVGGSQIPAAASGHIGNCEACP